jgi:hypothetical protein
MAGLLDFEDPRTMGLLNAGLGIMAQAGDTSRQFGLGQALASGLGTMQQTQLQAEMLKRQKAQEDLQMQMRQMQFGQMQQQIKDQEAAKKQAAMMPQIISQFGDDYQGMIKAGIDPALVKSIAESKNFGRLKVARVEELSGEGGKKIKQQFDEYGNAIGSALDGYVAPEKIDLGDKVVFSMPTVGAAFKKGMSAAEKDASARGWAGVQLQKDQLFKPQWNNDVGAFIAPPSKMNPQGQKIELAGYTKEEKPLTEVQAKAVTFASRMKNANDIVNELSGIGVDKSSAGKKFVEAVPFIGGGLGSIYNTTLPENIQKLDQAKRDWINANLRNESGAAIGKDEFYSADQQYFPQIGDKAEVIKQKAINRKLAEDGMRSQAGRGSMKIDSIVGGVKLPSTGGWSIQKVD